MAILERPLQTLSLVNYETRKSELVAQLISIAENDGFFALTDHGISEEEIATMFAMSKKFFALPESIKSKYPFERTKVRTTHHPTQPNPPASPPLPLLPCTVFVVLRGRELMGRTQAGNQTPNSDPAQEPTTKKNPSNFNSPQPRPPA